MDGVDMSSSSLGFAVAELSSELSDLSLDKFVEVTSEPRVSQTIFGDSVMFFLLKSSHI